MNKLSNHVLAYYGALITICILWLGVSFLHFHHYLSGVFFLCIVSVMFFLRYLERVNVYEELETLRLEKKRLGSKAWYFESIVTNSRDVIFTTDLDHLIIKFNRGSEQAFGCLQQEVLGQHVRKLFDQPEKIDHILLEVSEKGRTEAVEMMIINRDSREEIWLSVGASKLFDDNSEISGAVFTCSNISRRRQLEGELKEKNDQLVRLSITDSLTGLFNFRHLKVQLIRLQNTANRHPNRDITIVLIDVDKFKEYNDSLGHLAGDNLLIILSDLIRSQIRKDLDSAYRYGGDEFVLLFPDTGYPGARAICERIQNDFMAHHLGGTSLSIGIAKYNSQWGPLNETTLLTKADEAMNAAKCKGGNRIHEYGLSDNDADLSRSQGDIPIS